MKKINKCFWEGHNRLKWDTENFTHVCSYCGEYHSDTGEQAYGYLVFKFAKQTGMVLGIIGLVVLLFYAITALFIAPAQYLSCREFANSNGLEFVYRFFSGCLVNMNGHWVSPAQVIELWK